MLVNPNRVNPELLAKEVNIMMSKVGKKLDNISTEEGKITYAKKSYLSILRLIILLKS